MSRQDQAFGDRQGLMGPKWSKRAKRQLRLEPICEWVQDGIRCAELATDADHIVPRFEAGPDDGTAPLQSLCRYHHSRKTAAEGHRAKAQQIASARQRWTRQEPHPGDLKRSAPSR